MFVFSNDSFQKKHTIGVEKRKVKGGQDAWGPPADGGGEEGEGVQGHPGGGPAWGAPRFKEARTSPRQPVQPVEAQGIPTGEFENQEGMSLKVVLLQNVDSHPSPIFGSLAPPWFGRSGFLAVGVHILCILVIGGEIDATPPSSNLLSCSPNNPFRKELFISILSTEFWKGFIFVIWLAVVVVRWSTMYYVYICLVSYWAKRWFLLSFFAESDLSVV